ncbi:MAG TPA: hypothetical protein VFY63_09875 [Pseudorhizobium sp.]|nr:hypothetical protein [Pseudorhizobium sp.]
MPTGDDMTPEEARRDHREMLWFLVVNAAFGMALGVTVASALVWFNLYGLGTHIARSQVPILSFAMIGVALALTFGGAVTASAIMLMPYRRKKQI